MGDERIYAVDSGSAKMTEASVFVAHDSYVLDLLFTPDSQTLVSAGMDNLVKLWSLPDWALARTLEGHSHSVNSISLASDGATLATGSTDATVQLWSMADGKLLQTMEDRRKTVASVQISPDGQWVAAGSYGGRAMVWTLTGEEVVGIKASGKNLSCVAFSANGEMLATSGLGDDIHLWKLPSGEHFRALSGHRTAVSSLAFLQGGRYLLSLGYEGSIKLWDTETWKVERTLGTGDRRARGVVLSPDGQTMAVSQEGEVQFWSLEDWKLQAARAVGTKVINGMAFSADGKWFAAGAADRKIRIWQMQ